MGHINSPANVITLDAILSKKGRQLLSAGLPLNITKFALSDDEVDYALWNTGHPSGSDYYGVAIENLPLVEAVPDESKIMKYKLLTLPVGSTTVPIISTAVPTVTFPNVATATSVVGQTIRPFTQNGSNDNLGYKFTISNPEYFQYIQVTSPVPGVKYGDGGDFDYEAYYAAGNKSPAPIDTTNLISTKAMRGQTFSIIAKEIKLWPIVGSGAYAYYNTYAVPNTYYVETSVTINGRETGGYSSVTVRINFQQPS